MLGMPIMPKPMPAMTMRLDGATAPWRPRADAETMVGKPATPAAAIGSVFRNWRRFILFLLSLFRTMILSV